jgi:hypothetical protein
MQHQQDNQDGWGGTVPPQPQPQPEQKEGK